MNIRTLQSGCSSGVVASPIYMKSPMIVLFTIRACLDVGSRRNKEKNLEVGPKWKFRKNSFL